MCAFVASPVLADLTVTPIGNGGTYDGYGPYQSGQGGEFTLLPSDDLSFVLQYYADPAKDEGTPNTFQTFCIEETEYIYPNPTTAAAVFNDNAVYGGVGPVGDPISVGTAWLYSEFAAGTLSGYAYYGTSTARKASASELQNAIWYLEEEGGSLSTNYTNLLKGEFGTSSGIADWRADNYGQYAVKALNLYEIGTGALRQDVLVMVPLPGAILVGLIALGIAGLKLRKFA
jgi:hypothetical protein